MKKKVLPCSRWLGWCLDIPEEDQDDDVEDRDDDLEDIEELTTKQNEPTNCGSAAFTYAVEMATPTNYSQKKLYGQNRLGHCGSYGPV